jgi:hypothetical protein
MESPVRWWFQTRLAVNLRADPQAWAAICAVCCRDSQTVRPPDARRKVNLNAAVRDWSRGLSEARVGQLSAVLCKRPGIDSRAWATQAWRFEARAALP